MSGRLNHPPGTAGQAETPALTGKGDEMFVSASIAFGPQKAVFQATTSKGKWRPC